MCDSLPNYTGRSVTCRPLQEYKYSMKQHMILAGLFFLAGCASVAGVEITEDDTAITVLTATGIAVLVFVIKGYVEYQFAKRLERYKKQLEKE
jgi:uncharacterized membrane protein